MLFSIYLHNFQFISSYYWIFHKTEFCFLVVHHNLFNHLSGIAVYCCFQFCAIISSAEMSIFMQKASFHFRLFLWGLFLNFFFCLKLPFKWYLMNIGNFLFTKAVSIYILQMYMKQERLLYLTLAKLDYYVLI